MPPKKNGGKNRQKSKIFSPSVVPTDKDKQDKAEKYKEPLPYGLISKNEIDWIKKDRVELGRGTYGQVYKYTDTPNGVVAVKFVEHEGEIKESVVKEISFIKAINHPNVINITDIFYDTKNIAVILPLADYTLDKVRHSRKVGDRDLTPKLIDIILYQVLRGMVATQEHNILNGDYKAANILVYDTGDDDINVKIADFGLATLDGCYNVEDTFVKFTPMYRPPELFWQHPSEGYSDTRSYTESILKKAEEVLLDRVNEEKEEKKKKKVAAVKSKKKTAAAKKKTETEVKEVKEPERPSIEILEERVRRLKLKLDKSFPSKLGKNTKKADSWSYGVIILELLTDTYPFSVHGFSDLNHLEQMYIRLGRPTEETLPEIVEMPIYSSLEYIKFDMEFDEKLTQNRATTTSGYRTMDNYLKDIKPEFKKYIPLIKALLVLDPRERIELKELINSDVFDDIREQVDNNNKYSSLKRVKSPEKCSEYLRKYQYKKTLNTTPIFETPKVRFIVYDWLRELCEELRLPPRTKSIACKIIELFAQKNLEEAKKDGSTPSWRKENYQGYICAALLLACRFDGIDEATEDDLLYFTANSVTRQQLFTYTLTIFASVDFNLVKSTSYDLFNIYKTEDIESIGLVLLQFTYFTDMYSNFNNDIIASLVYVVSCIIRQKKINRKYARTGISDAWDMFRNDLVSLFSRLITEKVIGLKTFVEKKGEKKIDGEQVVKAMANIATPLGLPYTPLDRK